MATNINYYNAIIAGGTADAMTATVVPAQTVLLMDILPLWVRVPGTNATTTPTITINGVTTNITLRDGSAVAAGDLEGTVILSKNSGEDRFELLTPAVSGASINVSANIVAKGDGAGNLVDSAFVDDGSEARLVGENFSMDEDFFFYLDYNTQLRYIVYHSGTGQVRMGRGTTFISIDNSGNFGLDVTGVSASTVLIANGSKKLVSSSVTDTELGQLTGVSANVQDQINALQTGKFWKDAVRVATTASGTLATDFENGDTVDGVVLATGDRILIKDQATASQNGIYTVNASGAPTRSTDFDASADNISGATVRVEEGTTNAETEWTCSTNDPITVGVTNLTFVDTTGRNYIAGSFLTKTGNTFDQTTQDAGDLINSATAKTAPVDADYLGLMDSAAGNILKKLSLSNLKATYPYSSEYFFNIGDATYDGWIGPFADNFAPGTTTIAANILYGIPFSVARGVACDKIGIEVTGAGTAGSVIRLGVYADDGTGKPGALLLDAGTVTGDSVAVKTITFGSNLNLPNGKYYLAVISNSGSAITVRAVSATGGATPAYRGINITSFASGTPNRFSAALAYGSLPDPFTTAGLSHTNVTLMAPLIHPVAFL